MNPRGGFLFFVKPGNIKDFHEVKMSTIYNSKFKIHNFLVLTVLSLHLLITPPAFAQASSAPNTNVGQIKKNILKNKKTLAELQKKLREEQRQQQMAHVKEKNVLNQLQKVDQKLGSLRREKEVNEQDLV